MVLIELEKGKGYGLDFSPRRWDQLAVDALNAVFGRDRVTPIFETYKRSRVTLSDLEEDIQGYNIKRKPRLSDDPVYIAALQSVREALVPQIPLIPLTTGAAVSSKDFPTDKSPGLPFKFEGYKSKKDVIEDPKAMGRIRSTWYKIGEKKHVSLPDVMIFVRSQICKKETNKLRATWGYPMEVFVEESRFVYPYLEFLKQRRDDYPIAYGLEMVHGGMSYINECFNKTRGHRRAAMIDWKRFDKRVPAWLIRDAFSILKECFDFSHVRDSENKIWTVNSELTLNRWNRMVKYFIETPFRMPDGRRFKKTGGVASGSGWTNILDCIVNAIVVRYCAFHVTGHFPPYDSYMGDDSFFTSEEPVCLTKFSEVADEAFGFEVNVDKSYTTTKGENINFLGYYNKNGYPVRAQDFLIASFAFPERNDERSPVFTATRAIGQMWSTMNHYQATFWVDIVKWIQTQHPEDFGLGWFESYIRLHPSRLKFLHIYGIKTKEIYEISTPNFNYERLVPRGVSKHRRVIRRHTYWYDFYCRYIDDPMDCNASVSEDVDLTEDP